MYLWLFAHCCCLLVNNVVNSCACFEIHLSKEPDQKKNHAIFSISLLTHIYCIRDVCVICMWIRIYTHNYNTRMSIRVDFQLGMRLDLYFQWVLLRFIAKLRLQRVHKHFRHIEGVLLYTLLYLVHLLF